MRGSRPPVATGRECDRDGGPVVLGGHRRARGSSESPGPGAGGAQAAGRRGPGGAPPPRPESQSPRNWPALAAATRGALALLGALGHPQCGLCSGSSLAASLRVGLGAKFATRPRPGWCIHVPGSSRLIRRRKSPFRHGLSDHVTAAFQVQSTISSSALDLFKFTISAPLTCTCQCRGCGADAAPSKAALDRLHEPTGHKVHRDGRHGLGLECTSEPVTSLTAGHALGTDASVVGLRGHHEVARVGPKAAQAVPQIHRGPRPVDGVEPVLGHEVRRAAGAPHGCLERGLQRLVDASHLCGAAAAATATVAGRWSRAVVMVDTMKHSCASRISNADEKEYMFGPNFMKALGQSEVPARRRRYPVIAVNAPVAGSTHQYPPVPAGTHNTPKVPTSTHQHQGTGFRAVLTVPRYALAWPPHSSDSTRPCGSGHRCALRSASRRRRSPCRR